MEYFIRRGVDEDAQVLAPIMRDLDRDEVWASSGSTPLQALRQGLVRSVEVYTGSAAGVPFCMFGLAPYTALGNVAMPWMLTSDESQSHKKALLYWSKKVTHHWAAHSYPVLENFVDARHIPGLRLARWLGFTVDEAKPFGPFRLPFHRIQLRRE